MAETVKENKSDRCWLSEPSATTVRVEYNMMTIICIPAITE